MLIRRVPAPDPQLPSSSRRPRPHPPVRPGAARASHPVDARHQCGAEPPDRNLSGSSPTAAIIETRHVREFLRIGKLLTLMLCRFTVDIYCGVMPVLYPLVVGRF